MRTSRHTIRGVFACLALVAAPGCAEPVCSLEAGATVHDVRIDGVARRYHVIVGPKAEAPAPLVFLWHGYGASAASIAPVLEPGRFWPEAVVAIGEGLPRTFPHFDAVERPGWQIAPGEHGDRDLAFFDAMLEEIAGDGCIDRDRVYSTGFSNGGYFSNVLGCMRGDRLAAIAPVSGGGPSRSCEAPLAALVIHGTQDTVVPYEEGLASYRSWTAAAGCGASEAPPPTGCQIASGCRAAIQFCGFAGPHVWSPGTSERIVEFLRTKRRAP